MKFCEFGVYHHDCWNTRAITQFPEVFSMEWGNRCILRKTGTSSVSSSVWKVSAQGADEAKDYVRFLNRQAGVLDAKLLSAHNNDALVGIRWKSTKTSYEAVMESGCHFYSRTYSKNGYEAYSVFADDPQEIARLMGEMEQIGETRIFALKNADNAGNGLFGNPFRLTQKQKDAMVMAIVHGYYSWPRKNNLEKLAGKTGKKRRTLQENLRKAEAKVLPGLLDELTQA